MSSTLPSRRRHRAATRTAVVASALGLFAGCASEPTTTIVVVTSPPMLDASTSADRLPDPCKLVDLDTVASMIGSLAPEQVNSPVVVQDETLLFRTCAWGDETNYAEGAIGIQIGVPNVSGRDVVANRATALDPALATDIGDDGKETMLVAVMPNGGGRGTSIFFRHNGYSVLIGHVGEGARLRTIETLARDVIESLDRLPDADLRVGTRPAA